MQLRQFNQQDQSDYFGTRISTVGDSIRITSPEGTTHWSRIARIEFGEGGRRHALAAFNGKQVRVEVLFAQGYTVEAI